MATMLANPPFAAVAVGRAGRSLRSLSRQPLNGSIVGRANVTRRLNVPSEQAEFIRARVAGFEAEAPPELQWQTGYVREHQALPLYLGWTETIGIRADGTLVRWATEGNWSDGTEFAEDTWVNLAIVQGALRYPELHGLIPERPSDATTCDQCQGSGKLQLPPEYANVICNCGGIGWIPTRPRQ